MKGGVNMDLESLLYTLDICENYLPPETHPVHYERLKVIKELLKRIYK